MAIYIARFLTDALLRLHPLEVGVELKKNTSEGEISEETWMNCRLRGTSHYDHWLSGQRILAI
jgi:hypothetical protein